MATLLVFAFAEPSTSLCGDCKHGTCVDGVCACKAGFYGEHCQLGSGICVEATQEGCYHGTCKAGECICNPGYFGDRCDQKGCPDHCSFKGLCFEQAGEPAQCLCMHGHFGPGCAQSGCSAGCHHGKCVMARSGVIKCQCELGWAGADCNTPVCDPCVNGSCDGTKCVCEPGFTGVDCAKRACPDCGPRGSCDDTTGLCVCKGPYYNRPFGAPDCSGNEAQCPNRCTDAKQGICLSTGCQCSEGWSGADCSVKRCPKDCSGKGQCKNGQCFCAEGWSGAGCDEPTCPNQCSGRGVCVQGECRCLAFGASQAIAQLPAAANATLPTLHNATATSFLEIAGAPLSTAIAQTTAAPPATLRAPVTTAFFPSLPVRLVDAGYAGADCSQRACATDCGAPQGHGKCDTTTGVCVCAEGRYWKSQGLDCASTLCSAQRDCNGHGLCVDGACRCLEGYSGADCEVAVASLPAQAQSFLERASAASEMHRANTLRVEAGARAAAAKQSLLAALQAAENAERAAARAAVHADELALRALRASGERDAGVIAEYVTRFASRANKYKHVLGVQQGADDAAATHALLETTNATAAAKPLVAPAPAAPLAGTLAAQAALQREHEVAARFQTEMQAAKLVADRVAAANASIANGGQGCVAECSHRGLCVEGKCLCKDSHGDYCEHLSCPAGCSGHGACDPVSGKCMCADGYGGPACAEPECAPVDCSGHGACEHRKVTNAAGDVVAMEPVCVCAKGWSGPRCDVKVCSKTCSHRGICTGSGDACFCFPGFAGADCEKGPFCTPDCGLHGTCTAHVEGDKGAVSVGCVCKEGFFGPRCDQRQCAPEKDNLCGAHGLCVDFDKCLCEPGWEGARCERRNDCHPACDPLHGTCGEGKHGEPVCVCKPGFGGPACADKVCDKNCNGRGQCLNGECRCENGWSGAHCDEGCPHGCNANVGHGTCVADAAGKPRCQCKAPFTGVCCSIGVCPGQTLLATGKQVACSGHGTCDSWRGVCACDRGYTGADCATFSASECVRACGALCHLGQPGAFRVADPLTGESALMTGAQCMHKCQQKCDATRPLV